MATSCDCANCPDGAPLHYTLVISGTSNIACGSCSNFDGTWTLDRGADTAGCNWNFPLAPTICNYGALTVSIVKNAGTGKIDMQVTIGAGLHPGPVWLYSDIKSCMDGSYTLSLQGGAPNDCNWPSTVLVKAVPLSLTDPNAASCVPALSPGCSIGLMTSLSAPNLGATKEC